MSSGQGRSPCDAGPPELRPDMIRSEARPAPSAVQAPGCVAGVPVNGRYGGYGGYAVSRSPREGVPVDPQLPDKIAATAQASCAMERCENYATDR